MTPIVYVRNKVYRKMIEEKLDPRTFVNETLANELGIGEEADADEEFESGDEEDSEEPEEEDPADGEEENEED